MTKGKVARQKVVRKDKSGGERVQREQRRSGGKAAMMIE